MLSNDVDVVHIGWIGNDGVNSESYITTWQTPACAELRFFRIRGGRPTVKCGVCIKSLSFRYRSSSRGHVSIAVMACLLPMSVFSTAQAQAAPQPVLTAYSSSVTDLPAAPAPQTPSSDQPQQTKRILGIVPNFRAVSTTDKLPPQTVKDKFVTASQDSFDYSSIVLPAVVAAYDLGTNQTPEFGHGGVGYGRYLWHSVVDQTSENYFVEFIVPAITHQDTRFYTLRDGSGWHKMGYALTRVLITRADDGHETFNTSEILGSGMASALSNAYYPSRERTFANTGRQWGIDVGIDAATFAFKEFWPDINHAIFRKSSTTASH
jgi:subtilisin family serine protease